MIDQHKKILFVTLVTIWISNLFAQCPDTLWTKTYGGPNSDQAYSVQQTSDAGYIILGYTESYCPSGACLIKTDANGDTLWIKTYDGAFPRSIQQTSNGGYIWTGSISDSLLIVKTDSLGDTLWSRTYKGGNYIDRGIEVQQTTDGRYIVVGTTSRFTGVEIEYAIFLLRVDNNGDTLWTKKFGWHFAAWGYSVEQTLDGGYIVLGYINGNICLIKTDSAGNSLWQKIYDLGGDDEGSSVKITPDGGYIIAGRTGVSSYDICVIRTDIIGDTLWTRTYGGMNYDGGNSIVVTYDSCYVVVGGTESFGAGGCDVYLIKIDSLGNLLWSNTFGGTDFDAGSEIQQTFDKGYIIAGTTRSYGAGGDDVWLLKINYMPAFAVTPTSIDFGDVLVDSSKSDSVTVTNTGSATLDITSVVSDHAEFMVTPTTGSLEPTESMGFYITFAPTDSGVETGNIIFTHNAPTSPDTVSVTGNGILGIAEKGVEGITVVGFVRNPPTITGNSNVQIAYATTMPGYVSLKVYDAMGRLKKTLVNEFQPAGEKSLVWDAQDDTGRTVPHGVYFVRLEIGDYKETEKVIFLK